METVIRKTGSRSSGRRKKTYVIRRVKQAETLTSMPRVESPAAERPEAPTARPLRLSPEERYRAIAEAAYYKAERRGFQGGDPAQDWREAEAEIDAWILESEGGER